jgi:hypothetical protein
VQQVLQQLAESFTAKDLVVAHHLYGSLIHRISMSQERYMRKTLQRFGYQNVHEKHTPFKKGMEKKLSM